MTGSAHGGSSASSSARAAASLLTVPIFKPPERKRLATTESEGTEREEGIHADERVAQPESSMAEPEPRRQPEGTDEAKETGPSMPDGVEMLPVPNSAHRPAGDAPQYRNLRHYWRRLGRGLEPEVEELDPSLIAEHWPYTLLIRVPENNGPLDIVQVYVPANGRHGNGSGHPLSGDRYSQLSSWLLQLARETAQANAPVETAETFALDRGSVSFAVTVLPCASRADSAGYVLLNVTEI